LTHSQRLAFIDELKFARQRDLVFRCDVAAVIVVAVAVALTDANYLRVRRLLVC
jgi:hypothetical protein